MAMKFELRLILLTSLMLGYINIALSTIPTVPSDGYLSYEEGVNNSDSSNNWIECENSEQNSIASAYG